MRSEGRGKGQGGVRRSVLPDDRERAAPALFDDARLAEIVQEFEADLVIKAGQSSRVGNRQLGASRSTEDRPQPCERISNSRSNSHGHGVQFFVSFTDVDEATIQHNASTHVCDTLTRVGGSLTGAVLPFERNESLLTRSS